MSGPYYSRTDSSPPSPTTFYASPPPPPPPPMGGVTTSAPPDRSPYSLSPPHFEQPSSSPLFHSQIESTNQPYLNGSANQPYTNGANNQPYANGANNQPYQNGATNQPYLNGTTNQPYQNGATNQPYPNGTNNQPYQNGATNQPYPNGTNNQPYQNGATNQSYPNGTNNQPYQNAAIYQPYPNGATNLPYQYGAYYAPPAWPPPYPSKYSHHRKRRSKPKLCWNPCCCCGCLMTCLMTCICQIMCIILVIVPIFIFLGWLIFRPNLFKIYATDASLTQFDLKDNNLQYNLALNLTIRNPNKRIELYYDKIEANAFYQGKRFATEELQPFFQHHKSTNSLSTEFNGQNIVVLRNKQLMHYNDDKDSGIYAIDVKLNLHLRLEFLSFKLVRLQPKINCDLRIPLSGVASQAFESKRCSFVFYL